MVVQTTLRRREPRIERLPATIEGATSSTVERRAKWALVIGVAALGVAGCTADPPRSQGREGIARQALGADAWRSKTLVWGKGEGEVGHRVTQPELPGEGPSSIAVAPSGDVLILDRLNERAIAISTKGDVTVRAKLPRDAEHVAVGPDGALAAWSPLRAIVWITGKDGSALGELSMPRELREIERIDMGISHRVVAVSALQETVQLGSPRAPLDLGSTLRTRREGAAFLADGRGVASRTTESGAEIFAYRKPKPGQDTKPEIGWTYAIGEKVAAVRIFGAVGNAVCARVERVTQDTALLVEREALCVEADSGKVLLRQALGRPGIHPVHEELALGGDPPVVAFMNPEAEGLRVERLPLSVEGELASGEGVSR